MSMYRSVQNLPRSVSAVLLAGALTLSPVLVTGALTADAADTTPKTVRADAVAASTASGWTRIYDEPFNKPANVGSFVNQRPDDWYLKSSHPYATSLRSYPDGWGTTGNMSLNYASKTAGIAGIAATRYGASGVFQVSGHTETIAGKQQSLGGSFFPVIRPNATSNTAQTAQKYGRYTVRFRTEGGYPTGTASGAGYGSAFLLWPANDNWSEGEVDYPEMAWGGKIAGYVHEINRPQDNAHVINTMTPTNNTWHTARIEWYPDALVFYLDGVRIKKVTDNVPQTPFRWGFQSGGHDGTPGASVKGKLLVDYITVDAWAGAKAPI